MGKLYICTVYIQTKETEKQDGTPSELSFSCEINEKRSIYSYTIELSISILFKYERITNSRFKYSERHKNVE